MTSLFIGCGLILAGGAASVLLRRSARLADGVYAVLLVAGALLGVASAISVLRGATPAVVTFPGSLPGGAWAFGLDPLSAWFLLPILGVGACAGVFGIGYLAPERGHRSVALAHGLFALMLVALSGVVIAQATVPFLISWEVMALSGFLLVMFEHEQASVRRAGLLFVGLTHLSTLCLLAMFAALRVHADGQSFVALGAGNQSASTARTLALVLALVGFGLKAGAVPLHVWLPGAHAAAPSHVSAVLSGVMLNMGIYGLLRVLYLLGRPPVWLGWTLFGLGLTSGVLGVLWALGERDLKRVLAYSSVENVGIILLGLGVGALGLAYQQPAVTILGFTGALLHTLNHSLFKSLLFLGAGSVLRATGTRMIDQLGGLGRELPRTALAFGIGAVAIVGLPPLNGFIGEWLAVQGLLAGAREARLLALPVLGVAGLGLIGALALACFTRVVGGVFLGHPRRPRENVREDMSLAGPIIVLAVACILIGLVPILAVQPALTTAAMIIGPTGLDWAARETLLEAATGVSGMWILLLGVGGLIGYLRLRAARVRTPVRSLTWGCAYPAPTSRMQYTASSFTTPLMLAFGPVAAPEVERGAASLKIRPRDRVLDGLLRPMWRRARAVAAAFRPLQQGLVIRYLQYIVLTVLLLLGALFVSIVSRP